MPKIRANKSSLTQRARTLISADKLFSANGFSATSIRDIAQKAAVFDSLILQHFSA